MPDFDGDRLHALVGKMLGDLGGAYSVPTVRIGFRLGLFDALHRDGTATSAELADIMNLIPTKWVGMNWDPHNAYGKETSYPDGYNLLPKKRILNIQLERAVLAAIDFALSAEDRSFTSPELRANIDRMLKRQADAG